MNSSELTSSEIQEQFDLLQKKLVPLWEMIGRTDPGGPIEEGNTIVVPPSLTVDVQLGAAIQQSYEERFLFMLFLLRQPNIRMIYLSSQPINSGIVDYYLQMVPSVVASHARKRLKLVSPEDSSSKPLVKKILERPSLMPAPIENRYLRLFKEGKLTAAQRIPLEDGADCQREET